MTRAEVSGMRGIAPRVVAAMLMGALIVALSPSASSHTEDRNFCMGEITRIPDADPSSEEDPTILYVDDDSSGIWVYMEANTHPGLQRGGEHLVLGNLDADSCVSTHKTGPGSVPDLLLL